MPNPFKMFPLRSDVVQGYLAHKKLHPPRTLQQDHAVGPTGVLGGWAFSYEQGTPVRVSGIPGGGTRRSRDGPWSASPRGAASISDGGFRVSSFGFRVERVSYTSRA